MLFIKTYDQQSQLYIPFVMVKLQQIPLNGCGCLIRCFEAEQMCVVKNLKKNLVCFNIPHPAFISTLML